MILSHSPRKREQCKGLWMNGGGKVRWSIGIGSMVAGGSLFRFHWYKRFLRPSSMQISSNIDSRPIFLSGWVCLIFEAAEASSCRLGHLDTAIQGRNFYFTKPERTYSFLHRLGQHSQQSLELEWKSVGHQKNSSFSSSVINEPSVSSWFDSFIYFLSGSTVLFRPVERRPIKREFHFFLLDESCDERTAVIREKQKARFADWRYSFLVQLRQVDDSSELRKCSCRFSAAMDFFTERRRHAFNTRKEWRQRPKTP